MRAVLVAFGAVLAFLFASLRAPTLLIGPGAVAFMLRAADAGEERAELAESSELGRVPVARPSRGEAPGPPRVDGQRGAVTTVGNVARVPSAPVRLAEAHRAPRGTWTKPARTRAELMVFLN